MAEESEVDTVANEESVEVGLYVRICELSPLSEIIALGCAYYRPYLDETRINHVFYAFNGHASLHARTSMSIQNSRINQINQPQQC